ncbi:MAG: hypothetical protein WD471_02115, partial [Candidatus Paceibacterota bacterium]
MLSEFLSFLVSIITVYWWIIVLPFLIIILLDLWLFYKREKFKKGIAWSLIEIRIPKEIEKTPKAMEQIFASLQATYSFGILPRDKWLKGKVEGWTSFEIVGKAGRTHFLIRINEDYRDLLESAVYAQYPQAEISLVPEEEDYVNDFGSDIPNDEFDIFGTEFVLAREDAYPIRTYEYFEHAVKEEKRIDPIANLTEIMSTLESYELVWIQLLVRPTSNSWIKKAQELVDELMGEKKKKKSGVFDIIGGLIGAILEFVINLFVGAFEQPTWGDEKQEGDKDEKKKDISPGKRKIIEAIEEKMSKTGFETIIRFVYIDKKDDFSRSNISGVMGHFHQFSTQNLNSLRPNIATMPIARGLFKKKKILRKKRRLFAFA